MSTRIVVCLDGTNHQYLAQSDTPNLDAIAREGFSTSGKAVVPTVTNVNNTSIITASFPEVHGITSNYFLDLSTGEEKYMESSEYLLTETLFERIGRKGKKSALITAKDKLKTLINRGANIAESAENPSPWLVDRIGAPPEFYTIETNHWLFRAAREIIVTQSPDVMYLTTTDYATHTYPPEDERSQWNFHELDRLLGEILNTSSDMEIIVTADHGMNAKSYALDLTKILDKAGIPGMAIPIIKDRHVVHHKNLGGSAYIYLDNPSAMDEAMALLREERGVEGIMPSPEAARLYRLHPDRIGHLFVLADIDTVFGTLSAAREEVSIRSHGSLHEQEIPICGRGKGPMTHQPQANPEVAAWLAK
ncbi:MAG TPA: alkaline phosphatase family protein [Syntrophales bacterium]|nr:alkaline phosphatase family protein [Syntrophales bacterium]HPQ44301.1 alkaline phosphatase family protein [Syntrophales bacterium]